MKLPKDSTKARLVTALIGGVLCVGTYRADLYISDRQQYEDSNMLVSLVLVLAAAACIYGILKLISIARSSHI